MCLGRCGCCLQAADVKTTSRAQWFLINLPMLRKMLAGADDEAQDELR